MYLSAIAIVAICAVCAAESASVPGAGAEPLIVPTFHCLGIYWSPARGGADKAVSVKYREHGQDAWREGLAMRYNPVASAECKGDYRGSIVNLRPGTLYEVMLQLEGTDVRRVVKAATWSEEFPVGSVVKCESRDRTLNVDQSGTPEGYVLYDGTGCTIDTANTEAVGIAVRAKIGRAHV